MPVEIEIKSLLGSADAAAALRASLQSRGGVLTETSSQLNHYFSGDALHALAQRAEAFLSGDDADKLRAIIVRARKASVRTRLLNEIPLLIVKASLDDTTSANGITRLEFEAEARGMTLDQLDAEVLAAGFEYQAKWSRRRETYALEEIAVSLDKNAGYGWLAEFEIMAEDERDAPQQAERLRAFMADVGADELQQDRLERMFAYYNANWQTYYGTEQTFTIE